MKKINNAHINSENQLLLPGLLWLWKPALYLLNQEKQQKGKNKTRIKLNFCQFSDQIPMWAMN